MATIIGAKEQSFDTRNGVRFITLSASCVPKSFGRRVEVRVGLKMLADYPLLLIDTMICALAWEAMTVHRLLAELFYYVNPLTMSGRITDEASVFEDDLDW